jgi:hypothetical protein
MSACLTALLFIAGIFTLAQDTEKKSSEPAPRDAAIEAWRIEMNYVRANRPSRVNGFLVGSGGGMIGSIVTKLALTNIDTDAFACAVVEPVKADESYSAFVNAKEGQAWSMTNVQVEQYAYPIMAMVKSSNGQSFTIYPALLKAKINIKAGDVLHSGKYAIETTRQIKAGETFPVLIVSDSVLSAEAAKGAVEGSDSKPLFAAFPDTSSVPNQQ